MTEWIGHGGHGVPVPEGTTAESHGSILLSRRGVSRRSVLQGAVVASALALPSMTPAWAAALSGSGTMLAAHESANDQGAAFAERAARFGVASFDFTGDMARLWFDELRPRMQAGPAEALIGLTGAGALFCFEQLAWDVGMRVRLRIDHRRGAEGFRHVAGGEVPPAMLARLDAAKAAFGSSAMEVALGCRAGWADRTHAASAAQEAPRADTLVTWVIAPLDFA